MRSGMEALALVDLGVNPEAVSSLACVSCRLFSVSASALCLEI
jgi:hypothetical protein